MEKTMETYGKKYPKTAFALKQTASFGASEGIKLHEKEMIKSQQAESNIKMKGKVDVIGSRVESNKNKKNEK